MRSLLLVVLGCVVVAQCLPRDRFYAFGPSAGDRRLPRGDDTSSTEIPLDTPILFYENAYSSLYVSILALSLFAKSGLSYCMINQLWMLGDLIDGFASPPFTKSKLLILTP